MLKFLKPLSFIPAILMMYLIFSFSSQDGTTSAQLSYRVSYEIVEAGGKLLGADLEPWEIEKFANRFHGVIRKIAHMTEYFALAVSVSFPLYVYGLRGIWLMLVAGFFCVAFACGDEYHQSYVDGRGPSVRDVAIDSFGVFWGIVLVRIVGWTGRKTIFRPFSGKRKKKTAQEDLYNTGAPYPQNPYGNAPYQQNPYNGAPYQQNGYPQDSYRQGNYTQNPYDGSPYPQGSYSGTPYSREGYPQNPYQQGNYQQNPEFSGYRPDARNQNPYGYSQQNVSQHPNGTSDRLSEDMSLKKLVHDLKDQKKSSKTEE